MSTEDATPQIRSQPKVKALPGPGSRPPPPPTIQEQLRAAIPRAVETLIGLLDSDEPRIKLAAATLILDRTLGDRPIGVRSSMLDDI